MVNFLALCTFKHDVTQFVQGVVYAVPAPTANYFILAGWAEASTVEAVATVDVTFDPATVDGVTNKLVVNPNETVT